jgi:hypothetical protein
MRASGATLIEAAPLWFFLMRRQRAAPCRGEMRFTSACGTGGAIAFGRAWAGYFAGGGLAGAGAAAALPEPAPFCAALGSGNGLSEFEFR